MWLKFQNKGELEIAGLRLMGASSKRNDPTMRGFFGSGIKYAEAWALRNGATLVIYIGERRVEIGTRDATLRGQSFKEITVDGQGIGITTSIGPLWTDWMCVREFVTNALDEGEAIFETSDEVAGLPGTTRVFISYEHVKNVWENWRKYFRLDEEPIEETPAGNILPKVDEKTRVYRKGILVYTSDKESLYDYEADCAINEERIATNADDCTWAILDKASDATKLLVLGELKAYEKSLCRSWNTPSASWGRLLEGKMVVTREQKAYYGEDAKNCIVLPDAWVGALKQLPNIGTVERVLGAKARARGELDHRDPRRTIGGKGNELTKALKILAAAGIVIAQEDVILVEGFHDEDVMGSHDDGKIRVRLDLSAYDMGLTLLHEYAHKASGASDRTREFESFLDKLAWDLILGKGKLCR